MIKVFFLCGLLSIPTMVFSQNGADRPSDQPELMQQQLILEERQLDMERRLRYLEAAMMKQGRHAEKLPAGGNPANQTGPLDIEVIKKDKVMMEPMQPAPYPLYR